MSLMGQMMHMPLMISSLLTHAARHNGDIEIVSRRVEGDMHRTTWAEVELRARKLAQALDRLGVALVSGSARWPGTATVTSRSITVCRARSITDCP